MVYVQRRGEKISPQFLPTLIGKMTTIKPPMGGKIKIANRQIVRVGA